MPSLARTLEGVPRAVQRQMPVLDAIRGVAILMVLAHRFDLTTEPHSLVARVLAAGMDAGWIGVQLFFVLSGFLITGILLDSRERTDYYRSFFARRALRIFPLYYVVLFIAFVLLPLAVGRQVIPGHERQIWLWTYLSNWIAPVGVGFGAFSHCWSLAVEEQFYVVWPLVVRLARGRALPIVCVGSIVASIATKVVLVRTGVDPGRIYEITPSRLDALAMGALAAWALRQSAIVAAIDRRRVSLLVGTAILFVSLSGITRGYPRTEPITQMFGYTVLAWTALVLLVVLVLEEARGTRWASLVAPAALRSVGKYSYAMYVLHAPLHHFVGVPALTALGQTPPSAIGVSVMYCITMTALTFGIGVLSFHALEKHLLRLKSHFPGGRS